MDRDDRLNEEKGDQEKADREIAVPRAARGYWAANLRLLALLLSIWFAASFGAGVLFAEPLNAWRLGGYPLGFWFAQQGSIFIFVALIFYYAHRMRKIDRRFGVNDDDDAPLS